MKEVKSCFYASVVSGLLCVIGFIAHSGPLFVFAGIVFVSAFLQFIYLLGRHQ